MNASDMLMSNAMIIISAVNGGKSLDNITGHMAPTQSVCVADCYSIVNVLDLLFASLIAICR